MKLTARSWDPIVHEDGKWAVPRFDLLSTEGLSLVRLYRPDMGYVWGVGLAFNTTDEELLAHLERPNMVQTVEIPWDIIVAWVVTEEVSNDVSLRLNRLFEELNNAN